MIRNVGDMTYELELPIGSKIHNVFHVSCLNKATGHHISVLDTLPPLDDEVQLVLIPDKILKTRERRLRRREIKEYTWHNGRNCLVRKPFGKRIKFYSIQN